MENLLQRQRRSLAFFAVGCLLLLMTACKDTMPQPVQLVSGNKTFTLPAGYQPETASDTLLVFGFHYPSMEPVPAGAVPSDDQVHIFLSRAQSPERTASVFNREWQQRFGSQYDPKLPGKEYGGARQGSYQIYFYGAPEDIKKTIYFFHAHDGELVRIDVPGDWGAVSIVSRTLGEIFDLKYLVAKPIRKDFIELDKDIVDFLKQQIHTTP